MARANAPLLSVGASGAIARGPVFRRAQGGTVIATVPPNLDRDTSHLATQRDAYKAIAALWRDFIPAAKKPYKHATRTTARTPWQLALHTNLSNVRQQGIQLGWRGSTGNHGAPTLTHLVNIGECTPNFVCFEWGFQDTPPGWTLLGSTTLGLLSRAIGNQENAFLFILEDPPEFTSNGVSEALPGQVDQIHVWPRYRTSHGHDAEGASLALTINH